MGTIAMIDCREREEQAREQLAEHLKRLRALVAEGSRRRQRVRPASATPPAAPTDEPPTFWWQR
jgi:hypothetical protein